MLMLCMAIIFRKQIYMSIIILVSIKIIDYTIRFLLDIYIETIWNVVFDIIFGCLGFAIGLAIATNYINGRKLIDVNDTQCILTICRLLLFIIPAIIITIFYLMNYNGFIEFINEYFIAFSGIFYNYTDSTLTLINYLGLNILLGLFDFLMILYYQYLSEKKNSKILLIIIIYSIILMLFQFPQIIYYLLYYIICDIFYAAIFFIYSIGLFIVTILIFFKSIILFQ